MNPPHLLESLLSATPSLRLPGEILYIIGSFSSFESLVNLVQCNKWLYKACSPLLFREIHIWSSPQITKLCSNEKAMGMLSRTKSLILGDAVFLGDPQESIPNMPVPDIYGPLIRVLHSMPALTQLQVSGRYMDSSSSYASIRKRLCVRSVSQLRLMLEKHTSDPTFLPNLAIFYKFHASRWLLLFALCRNRPVVYYCGLNQRQLYLQVCPGLGQPNTNGTNISEAMCNISPLDVGSIVRHVKLTGPSPPTFGLDIFMRFPDEIIQHKPCPITDPLPWVQTMLAAAHLSADELEYIEVQFEPPLPRQSLAAQHIAIEELHRSFPSLYYASISSPLVRWYHLSPHWDLPDWMVRPNLDAPETIDWWCNALKLGSPDLQNDEEVEEMAKRLGKGTGIVGWGGRTPSVEELINHIRHQ